MFSQLKSIIDLVRQGVIDFKNFKTSKQREDAVLNLLRVYFVLKDCVEDGEALVNEAQPNPVETIINQSPEMAIKTLTRWDEVIIKQGRRLSQLQSAFLGQHHLEVINPSLQESIIKVIGYKFDRTLSLHGIGAALFFRGIFPITNTAEEKARYVSLMAGQEGDVLNMPKITEEIEALKHALNDYRDVVERMVSNEELLRLSQQARIDIRS
ncbi:hypothetical protein V4F78_004483 [Serratia marcescens]